jgi:hypothetical protein
MRPRLLRVTAWVDGAVKADAVHDSGAEAAFRRPLHEIAEQTPQEGFVAVAGQA